MVKKEIPKKLIVWTGLIYILVLFLGIIIARVGWIKITTFLIVFIFIPFFVIGAIGILWFWWTSSRKNKNEDDDKWNQEQKIDSSTVEQWVKDLILARRHTSFEITNIELLSSGDKGKEVPIYYVSGYGLQSKKYHNIFINSIEPEKRHSIIEGSLTKSDIVEKARNLTYRPEHKKYETILVKSDDGIVRETRRELQDVVQIQNDIQKIKNQ